MYVDFFTDICPDSEIITLATDSTRTCPAVNADGWFDGTCIVACRKWLEMVNDTMSCQRVTSFPVLLFESHRAPCYRGLHSSNVSTGERHQAVIILLMLLRQKTIYIYIWTIIRIVNCQIFNSYFAIPESGGVLDWRHVFVSKYWQYSVLLVKSCRQWCLR